METYKIVSLILKELESKIATGVALFEINEWGRELMTQHGVESADYQYQPRLAKTPFPGYLCISVNDTICHGVPTAYRLQDGDIVNIDVGIKREGSMCADASFTLPVGEIAGKDRQLLKYAKRALYAGIDAVSDGVPVYEVGRAIEEYAVRHGFVTNHMMTGHTIGKEMHERPYIPSYYEDTEDYRKYFGGVLKEGMVICLEPMLTYGRDTVGHYPTNDFWTYATRDGKNSAMFEHMVRVEKDGYTVLTDHFDESWFERGGKYD